MKNDPNKAAARRLRERLAELGVEINHSHSLEGVAAVLGARNWQTLQSSDKGSASPAVDSSTEEEGDFEPYVLSWSVSRRYADGGQEIFGEFDKFEIQTDYGTINMYLYCDYQSYEAGSPVWSIHAELLRGEVEVGSFAGLGFTLGRHSLLDAADMVSDEHVSAIRLLIESGEDAWQDFSPLVIRHIELHPALRGKDIARRFVFDITQAVDSFLVKTPPAVVRNFIVEEACDELVMDKERAVEALWSNQEEALDKNPDLSEEDVDREASKLEAEYDHRISIAAKLVPTYEEVNKRLGFEVTQRTIAMNPFHTIVLWIDPTFGGAITSDTGDVYEACQKIAHSFLRWEEEEGDAELMVVLGKEMQQYEALFYAQG